MSEDTYKVKTFGLGSEQQGLALQYYIIFFSLRYRLAFWLLYYSSDSNKSHWKLNSLFSVSLVRSLRKGDSSW